VGRLRVIIYHRNNAVQSLLLTSEIGADERMGDGTNAWVDYSLTAEFSDLGSLPARTLNILTNDNPDGTHRIVIKGREHDLFAFNVTEGQMKEAVHAARAELWSTHAYDGMGRSDPGSRLDSNNAKPREEFVDDLRRLARLGWQLWTGLLANHRDRWRALTRKLSDQPRTIQVARTRSSTFVFPWALIYDIPLDGWKGKLCRVLGEGEAWGATLDPLTTRCPFEHEHEKINTICPFGFWGFRHVIEQPPPMPDGRSLPSDIFSRRLPYEFVVGLSRDLDKEMVGSHMTSIRESLDGFHVLPCDTRDQLVQALSHEEIEIIYFLCHAMYEEKQRGGDSVPFLEMGEEERIFPQDIAAWGEGLWPEDHWGITSPLVFINGCHTAGFTPQSLLNFVDVFTNANASGVIGTEIQVHERLATEVAETFFRHLKDKLNVGDALRRTRIHFLRKGNLLGLAYTPYCSTNLKISLLEQRETSGPRVGSA
jgi:hypothetical protein